jgi:hypothetical protein
MVADMMETVQAGLCCAAKALAWGRLSAPDNPWAQAAPWGHRANGQGMDTHSDERHYSAKGKRAYCSWCSPCRRHTGAKAEAAAAPA